VESIEDEDDGEGGVEGDAGAVAGALAEGALAEDTGAPAPLLSRAPTPTPTWVFAASASTFASASGETGVVVEVEAAVPMLGLWLVLVPVLLLGLLVSVDVITGVASNRWSVVSLVRSGFDFPPALGLADVLSVPTVSAALGLVADDDVDCADDEDGEDEEDEDEDALDAESCSLSTAIVSGLDTGRSAVGACVVGRGEGADGKGDGVVGVECCVDILLDNEGLRSCCVGLPRNVVDACECILGDGDGGDTGELFRVAESTESGSATAVGNSGARQGPSGRLGVSDGESLGIFVDCMLVWSDDKLANAAVSSAVNCARRAVDAKMEIYVRL
jgi:hypothetical protein